MTLGTAPISDTALAGANHFHPIRLVAALLVLFAHAFHLAGRGGEEPIGRWFIAVDASLVGVAMFFFVSGFLVARSWDVRRSPGGFLAARALRIVPALWVALAVTVFVIGPVFTTLPRGAYLSDGITWKYLLLNAILRPQYLLPGVFESNPLPGVNGSLWTIPLEATCYAILAALAWCGAVLGTKGAMTSRARRSPLHVVLMMAFAIGLAVKIAVTSPIYAGLALEFALGVIVYRHRSRVGLNPVVALLLLAASVALARTSLPIGGAHASVGALLLAFAVPYSLLVAALHPAFAPRSPRAGWIHRNDCSYGTYLYGFPVQQATIALGVVDPVTLMAIAVPVTLSLAAASWFTIERRALAWKRRSPAREDAHSAQ